MENQHRLVNGYRDLSQAEIDAMNSIKLAEQDIGQLFQQIRAMPGVDQRCMALAKTGLQEAFSWFVRAVAQPLDVYEMELPISSHVDVLLRERDDLTMKLQKMTSYMQSEEYASLDPQTQADMRMHVQALRPYVFAVTRECMALSQPEEPAV